LSNDCGQGLQDLAFGLVTGYEKTLRATLPRVRGIYKIHVCKDFRDEYYDQQWQQQYHHQQ
jgi:hypothetical protein